MRLLVATFASALAVVTAFAATTAGFFLLALLAQLLEVVAAFCRVAASVVVDAEGAVVHLFLASLWRALSSVLGVGLGSQNSSRLALGLVTLLVGLGPLWRVVCRGHLGEKETLFSLGALVCDVEELHDRGEGVVDAELLKHPTVSDALSEGSDDVRVRDVGDLVADLAEALDVLAESLARLLAYSAQVVVGEGALVRALEVRDELLAEVLP